VNITIPKFCLVVLIGASGAGKSSFAKKHFKMTEVVSSDYCRGLVCDDENDQSISEHAFDLLHYIVEKRLIIGRLTVVDATNLQEQARRELINIANRNNCLSVAVIFNLSEQLCRERNRSREDRQIGENVIRKHNILLKKTINIIHLEGFKYIYELNSQEEVNNVQIKREG
jgi:protein phosphatase